MPYSKFALLVATVSGGIWLLLPTIHVAEEGEGITLQFNRASGQSAGEITEKEAFDSAKELGTIEAWQAFLEAFPTGFRADLARAYVRKLGSARRDSPPIDGSADVTMESFNCPEGIPLVVEFQNSGSVPSATVSIDGSPRTVLKNVESGSGSMYSNGEWTLHVKGGTAIINTPSGEDICTQDLP